MTLASDSKLSSGLPMLQPYPSLLAEKCCNLHMNLVQSLEAEASELLQKANIFDVLTYAWDDQETPSDRYIGLAMWLQDAPFQLNRNVWHRKTPPPAPTLRDEFFLRAGEDFVGTMNFARRALGLALYSHTQYDATNLLDEDDPLWEHHAIAAQWLNIASDRVRDYFVMARFNVTTDEFLKLDREHKTFHRAFTIPETDEGPNALTVLKQLRALIPTMKKNRKMRNDIVHAVASRQGQNALSSLQNQREEAFGIPFEPKSLENLSKNYEDHGKIIAKLANDRVNERVAMIEQLRSWYLNLVDAGSMAFEYEYWRRVGK